MITLLTDFGTVDAYAGILHGVILCINPQAAIVDLTHNIAAQDVQAAAFALSTAYSYFRADTVHVAVVDPGVGGERRGIAVRTPRGTFVAPDNGVLSYVLARESVGEMVHLTNARYWLSPLSNTFHARDLFAPVAAHLSLGVPVSEMGSALQDPVRFALSEARIGEDGRISGQVLHVDRFGNLITNVPGAWLSVGRSWRVRVADRDVRGPLQAYVRAADGDLLGLIGSSGYLEIAMRNGSAADALQLGRGAEVQVGETTC